MDERKAPFTKREATACFFASSMAATRNRDAMDVPELMRDAFVLADAFLDACEDQKPIDV